MSNVVIQTLLSEAHVVCHSKYGYFVKNGKNSILNFMDFNFTDEVNTSVQELSNGKIIKIVDTKKDILLFAFFLK